MSKYTIIIKNVIKLKIEVIALYKTEEELNRILDELLLEPENECVEFKKAENNFDIDNLGKYFSALGNEATLRNR